LLNVRTLLFASYRDLAGCEAVEIRLAPGATVEDLVTELRRATPGLDRLPTTVAVAVNQRYVPASETLHDGDEVALIPPVAGG